MNSELEPEKTAKPSEFRTVEDKQDKVGSRHEQGIEANQSRIQESVSGPIEGHAGSALTGGAPEYSSRGVGPNRSVPPGFVQSGPGEIVSIEAVQAMWQGALPHPSDFQAYELTLPGAANRIVTMAEESNTIRNASLEKAVDAEAAYARSGQRMAFSIAGFSLVAAVVFFAFDKHLAGLALVSFPLVLMIRSFLTGKTELANEN